MRPIERIDNFLNKVDWFDLLNNRWKINVPEDSWKTFAYNMHIRSNWKENPDQRIGQLLINLGIIPDSLIAWNDEEFDILRSQGYPLEECLFWGSVLDKNENILEKPITRLVANLDKSHIRNIKNYFNKRQVYLPSHYVEAFNNVLNKK